jgi:hypothetical protein
LSAHKVAPKRIREAESLSSVGRGARLDRNPICRAYVARTRIGRAFSSGYQRRRQSIVFAIQAAIEITDTVLAFGACG